MERRTVLVVDDDANQSLLYEQELTDEGYCVALALDGREALRKLEETSPDVVVLDVVMPGMDGVEVLGHIQGEGSKPPVILNTAYSALKDNPMTESAAACVVKSSDLTRLKEEIQRALERTEKRGG